MKKKIIGLIALLLSCHIGLVKVTAASLQKNPESVYSELKEQVPLWLKEYAVPSVSVAYIIDNKLAWTQTFGEQSPGIPASGNTLYNIASMSKPISAELILRLAAKGWIDLDESLSKHWIDPDIKNNPWHKLLTPRINLSHQTGFPNWRRDEPLNFQFKPGTRSAYSGEAYEYVARFAALKLNQGFEKLVQHHVFGPIGMDETAYTERPWFKGRVAMPMGPEGELGQPDIREQYLASDDVHTTVKDYSKFMLSVMRGDELSTEMSAKRFEVAHNLKSMLCHPERLKQMHCPEHMGFALGWSVFKYKAETVIMHGGGDWGERTLGFYVPERRLGLVVFTNGANGMKVIRDITKMLYDNPAFIAFLSFQAGS